MINAVKKIKEGKNVKSESRIENSIRNLKTAWICQFLMILLKFVTRRLFTQSIPDEYLGLENLYTNIIGILNLADLGIGTAIGYSLYRPLAEKDEEKVAALMRYMAVIFRRIAMIILILGIIAMPFLSFFAPEIKKLPHAYLVYLFYLAITLSGYLLGYKSTLCSADQQQYIYTRNHYCYALLLNVLQGGVLLAFRSYMGYATVQVVFVLAEYMSLSVVMNRRYPILKRKNVPVLAVDERRKLWRDTKYLAVGKVGYQLITSTDTIVISKLLGLAINGIYGNYVLITSAVATIFDQIVVAITGSVGNLVVTETEEKKVDVFWQLQFVQISLYVWGSVCMYNLIQPFIAYWVGSNYWLDTPSVLFIIACFYLRGCRSILNVFRNAYGLFRADAIKSPVEAIINLLLSIVLAYRLGVAGVALGTILSTILFGMWIEVYSLNQVLHIGIGRFAIKMIGYTIVGVIVLLLSQMMCTKVSMHWYIRLPMGAVISSTLFAAIWGVCFGRTQEFRELFGLLYGKLKAIFGPCE